MKKIYPVFFFLLWNTYSIAQRPLMQTAFTAIPGSLILDYRYGKVLTVQQNAGAFIYTIIDIKTGAGITVPLTKKYQPTVFKHIAEHHNAWITPNGALIVAQSPTNDSVWALYELYQSRFKKLAENIGNVHTAGDYAIWSDLDTSNKGALQPAYRNITFRYMSSADQFTLTDSAVADADIAVFPDNPLIPGWSYSAGKALYWAGMEWDHTWPTSAGRPKAFFYGIDVFYSTVAYLRHIDNENTDVSVSAGREDRFMSMSDKGSALYFPEVFTGLQLTIADYKIAVVAGVMKTNTDTNRLEGKIYIRDYLNGTRYLQDLQPGTPFAYANVTDISYQRTDIGVRAAAEGQAPAAYLFSYDGRLKKKMVDNATGMYYENKLWYVTDSQHLYVTNIDTVYNYYVNASEKVAYTNTRTLFSLSDFNTPYSGPDTGLGRLQRIQITALPRQGVLADKNNQAIPGNNAVIERADLDSIKYSATRIPGLDSLRWRAFDGIKWTQDTVMYINVKLNPGMVTPFERTTLAGTPIRFWASNFKQHYSAGLCAIRINTLPKYGNLTIGGKRIYYERSNEVTLAEIDSMYYTAHPNITGVDTLQWMAYNNESWSFNDTAAIMRVYPVLNTPPILRTLENSYSKTAAPDTILIVNYPRPTWHTDTKVVVDNNRILPVDTNKNFILDPSLYTTGSHQLKVSFQHPRDSISITRMFTITGGVSSLMISDAVRHDRSEEAPGVWPNPFDQQFTISGLDAGKAYLLRLYDAQGRNILTDRVFYQSRKVLQLSNSHLAKGVYMLEISDGKEVNKLKLLHL
ncbi:T9SS type A sorting domain-containing protein [Chitinophaga sp. RCC_12]|uniref:T9SS type A sorting domain-containing protein n=1 Tax=Chitinophaga sp. RCC_12 TaxID=3239226 RepID=UPI003525DF4D